MQFMYSGTRLMLCLSCKLELLHYLGYSITIKFRTHLLESPIYVKSESQ